MNAIRSTAYTTINTDPETIVVLERDLKVDTAEEFVAEMTLPGMLVTFDVFEVADDSTLEAAILEAGKRITDDIRERERHQSTAYHWYGDMLRVVKRGGMIVSPAPAPMTVADAENVLTQLARHPNYRQQMVEMVVVDDSDNLVQVTMKDGEVSHIAKGQG